MAERPTERDYEVVSKKFYGYKVGDIATLLLTDNQELSLLESGAVKRVAVRPSPAVKSSKEVK